MKSLILALAILLAAPALADEGKCPRLTPKTLDEIAASRGGKLKVIFFASWCAACKDHLIEKTTGPTILVGAFDKRERLEEVVQSLGIKTECYTDDGIADALGVKSLPATVNYGVKTGGE